MYHPVSRAVGDDKIKLRTHLCFIRHIPRISKPVPQPLQSFPIHARNLGDGLVKDLKPDAEF